MLAGVAGIDFVVFVIAADESIKPQTREHFEICRLLGIRSGIVALTKSDLVDAESLEVVKLEVGEFVEGSFLEGAAVLPVSVVNGNGLQELRAEITRLARQAQARDTSQQFRLSVDRSFVMPGFGTVVTGTVTAGSVAVENELQAYPGPVGLRVRGIQVHGRSSERASAGQRAALNIAGVDHQDLARGMSLGPSGAFAPAMTFDGVLQLLSSAKPLKNRAPVHLHTGTAEVQAEVRTLDHSPAVEPGSTALVRFILREPLLALPGDRFIIRMFSPVTTIGGGEVVDANPPRRASRAALIARAQKLANASLGDRIALLVSESPDGISLQDLTQRTGQSAASLSRAKPPSIHSFGDWWIHDDVVRSKLATWKNQMSAYHRANPLLPGHNKEELRSRGLRNAPANVFEAVLALDRQIAVAGEFVRLASHKITLQEDEREASSRIEGAFERAGLQTPSAPEVLKSSGVDASRARTLLQILVRERKLVRVSDDLVFHSTAIDSLRQSLAGRKGQSFTVADFKEWTGISRKYAIPLLEWLDRERVSRREGDVRIVL